MREIHKAPVYAFFIDTLGWGGAGGTAADMLTVIINAAISFWVFFPIFEVIFRQKKEEPVDADPIAEP